MSRSIASVSTLVLLLACQALFAQHHGGQGSGGGNSRPASTSKSDDLQDFKRAMALQATQDQIAQFRLFADSTKAARKSAQDFLQLAANSNQTSTSKNTEDLSGAIEDAQTNNERFLGTFSPVQKSELKKLTKNLSKASSEINKLNKTLSRGDSKQLSDSVEKIDKQLGEFETNQSALAKEMGIPPEGESQKPEKK